MDTTIQKDVSFSVTHMFTKSFVIICCLIVIRSVAFADPNTPDGNDWNGWNERQKFGYVNGFANGANGVILGIFAFGDKPNQKLAGYVITGMTMGQLIDGINLLYTDFMNRSIPLVFGIYVVNRQIKGTPQDDIEKILLWLRSGGQWKNKDKFLVVKDSNGKYIKTIVFP